MSYYQRHIFFCLNQRINGEASCGDHDAKAGFDHCKQRVAEAGLSGKGHLRLGQLSGGERQRLLLAQGLERLLG